MTTLSTSSARPPREPMFGRKNDLAHLHERIKAPGITFLAARPQQGKTRLLQELLDDLRYPPPGQDPTVHVGYAQSTRQEADVFLRALEDLYVHWLSNATFLDQAQKLWKDRQSSITEILGYAAAKTLSPIFKIADPTGAISETVKNSLQGLVNLNADLTSGGITLPRLQHDQARALLRTVHELSSLPAVLILDAFEQSPDPHREAGNLQAFMQHANDWPPLHVLSAVRAPTQGETEEQAYTQAQQLKQEFALVEIVNLPPMDLSNLEERDNISQYLHDRVPATAELSDDELFKVLDGYPGTLKRWKDKLDATIDELGELSADAQALRYREIPPIFKQLKDKDKDIDLFRAAIRLALLPELTSEEMWEPFSQVVGCTAIQLTELRKAKLLLSDRYPDFGLTARYEFARNHLFSSYRPYVEAEAERIIPDLAEKIKDVSPSTLSYSWALAQLKLDAQRLTVSGPLRGLCEAAITLISREIQTDPDLAISAARQQSAPILVAMGLVNANKDGASEHQAELLGELRSLAKKHPNTPAVRESLAMGLFNTFNHAAPQLQTKLLDELRSLAEKHPDEPTFRKYLATALFNAFHDAAPKRQAKLLKELWLLAKKYPDDSAVGEELAKDLVNAMRDETSEFQTKLLNELRSLAKKHPNTPAVRESLAKGIFNAFDAAAQDLKAQLINELRSLAKKHPDEPAFREQLARSLFNAFLEAQQNDHDDDAKQLLKELLKLTNQYPHESIMQDILSKITPND